MIARRITYCAIPVLFLIAAMFAIAGNAEDNAAEMKDPIVISGRADSTEIFIGDQFTFELRVDSREGIEVTNVEPPMELGQFEILEVNPSTETSRREGLTSRIYSYLLSTYDTGEFEIPPFTVSYKTPSGESKKAFSRPIAIKVNPIAKTAEDTTDIRDIKSPIRIEPKPYLRDFLILVLAVLVAGALALFFILRYLRARREREPEVWIPPRPIEELALEELDALEKSGPPTEGKIKEYYTRASEIVRIYLGRRFHVNAIDLTSYELLQILEEKPIPDGTMNRMEGFFELCDLIKFARHRPEDDVHSSTLEKARLIVRETTPAAPSPSEPEEREDSAPEPALASTSEGGDKA